MPEQTYFEKIEEKIKQKEKELGRKLTIDEQDEMKMSAMTDLWVEASKEVKDEGNL